MLLDRVMVATATTGTGTVTLGAAVAGYRTFAAAGAVDGLTYDYTIIDGNAWEVGRGTYAAGANTMTRVLDSSSTGALLVLSGAATVFVAATSKALRRFEGEPATPPAGLVEVGVRNYAGRDMLAVASNQGWDRVFQTLTGTGKVIGYIAASGIATFDRPPGTPNLVTNWSSIGTATAVTVSITNRATRESRVSNVSAATAGSFAGWRTGTSSIRIIYMSDGTNGGFFSICRFVVSDPQTTPGARMFIGLANSAAAPTNVNPASLTNVIGVAQVDGSTNLNIVFAGASTNAPIDLGPNFPANTLTADLYELALHCAPGDPTQVGWRVARLNTGDVASGVIQNTVPGTTLPASSTIMYKLVYRGNNTQALVVSIDVASFVTHLQ